MTLECLTETTPSGQTTHTIIKGRAVVMHIGWRYDHSGRGRNWCLRGSNVCARFKTPTAAKTAACRILGATGIVTV